MYALVTQLYGRSIMTEDKMSEYLVSMKSPCDHLEIIQFHLKAQGQEIDFD